MGQICGTCCNKDKQIAIEDANRNAKLAEERKKKRQEDKPQEKVKIYEIDVEKKVIQGPAAKKIAEEYEFFNPPIEEDEATNTEIRRGRHKKMKNDVLIKIFKNLNESEMKNALSQVGTLQLLENPCILRIKEAYCEENRLYIVTEQLRGDILFVYISKIQFTPEEQIAFWIKDILQAVNYLHSQGIAHREINPSNLMFSTEENQGLKLFNMSSIRCVDPKEKMQKKGANCIYSAPELYKSGQYEQTCDIWGVGVIMYVLCAQVSPFYKRTPVETIKALTVASDEDLEKQMEESEEWSRFSPDAKDFVKLLLKIEPDQRITAEKALQHKWITTQTAKALDKEHLQSQISNMKISKKLSSQKDRLKIEEQFKVLDQNGDGTLTKEELINGLKKLMGEAEAKAEVEDIFSRVDKDNSGIIQYNEYLEASLNAKEYSTKENLKNVFDTFTSDTGKGISTEDIKTFFQGTEFYKDDNYFKKLIEPFDKDNSGFLDFEEFVQMMETQCKQEL